MKNSLALFQTFSEYLERFIESSNETPFFTWLSALPTCMSITNNLIVLDSKFKVTRLFGGSSGLLLMEDDHGNMLEIMNRSRWQLKETQSLLVGLRLVVSSSSKI